MASEPKTDFWFDKAAAAHAAEFFPDMLVHTEAEWKGDPFELEEWQSMFIRRLFGWKRRDGSGRNGTGPDATRRYRVGYMEIPKKNGKSTMIAGLGNYLLYADNEPGSKVFSAAGDRDQAGMIFEPAKQMVMENPILDKASHIYKKSIVVKDTGAIYKVLSADSYTKHGLNAHGVLFDELHVQKKWDLYNTLRYAGASRRQPLFIMITTAGIYDPESVAWSQHKYAEDVLAGVIDDPHFLAVIYKADDDEDWTDEKVWAKANPNLGISVKIDSMREECVRAQENPAEENNFRQLRLNQWTQQRSRWIPVKKWDECYEDYTEEDLLGRECHGGLDLGSVSDLTSFSLAFPDEDSVKILHWAWCPEATLRATKNQYREAYIQWARDGDLRVSDGDTIDYGQVREDILQIAEKYKLVDFNVDRLFQADQLTQELADEGMVPVPMGQGMYSMAAPMREFEDRLLSGRIKHNGDPVLRWAVNNICVKRDAAGNVKPDKGENPQAKIDPFVSLVMALERIMRREDDGNVYSDRAATGEEMVTWIE